LVIRVSDRAVELDHEREDAAAAVPARTPSNRPIQRMTGSMRAVSSAFDEPLVIDNRDL